MTKPGCEKSHCDRGPPCRRCPASLPSGPAGVRGRPTPRRHRPAGHAGRRGRASRCRPRLRHPARRRARNRRGHAASRRTSESGCGARIPSARRMTSAAEASSTSKHRGDQAEGDAGFRERVMQMARAKGGSRGRAGSRSPVRHRGRRRRAFCAGSRRAPRSRWSGAPSCSRRGARAVPAC